MFSTNNYSNLNKEGGLSLIIFVSTLSINKNVVECWKFITFSFFKIPVICVLTGIDKIIENPTETEIKNWLNKNEKSWQQVVGSTNEIIPVCVRVSGIDTESEKMLQLRKISLQAVWQAIERDAKDNVPVVVQSTGWCSIV